MFRNIRQTVSQSVWLAVKQKHDYLESFHVQFYVNIITKVSKDFVTSSLALAAFSPSA